MSARKSFAGLVAATLAGSALALTASPAFAAEPDDPSFVPVAADLIGVGSDTIQGTLHLLAEGSGSTAGWNDQLPPPAARIASFSATGGGNITLPGGDIVRPNGSGAGKGLLYGASNNTDIDFARSSSAISTTEQSAGLKAFPFALDTLKMAVSKTVASHAPTSLTPAQILGIYKGDFTTWDQVGGTSTATIAPKVPQAGSGTRSFFLAQLQTFNGGVAVTLGGSVVEVQEHDDTPIKNDPDAIAPFSVGRAALLGNTLRLENGFSADRALYDVVRGTDLANPTIQAVFGEDGFVCSTAARPLIEASGFQQLATPAHGGVCGQATDVATSNFTLNRQVVTTTKLAGSNPKAGTVHLVATVTGSTAPDGAVTFLQGSTVVKSGVPLVQGKASVDVKGVTGGGHSYTANFVPAGGSAFEPSTAKVTVVSRKAAKISETFPAATVKGKPGKGTVSVAAVGSSTKPTGTVKLKLGAKTLSSKKLANGKATFTLPKLAKGKRTLTIVYSGDAKVIGGSKTFTIIQK